VKTLPSSVPIVTILIGRTLSRMPDDDGSLLSALYDNAENVLQKLSKVIPKKLGSSAVRQP